MSEQDTMAVLAAVLADPQAAAQRLKDMNAARSALDRSKLDDDNRKAELAKTEADANKVYKEASEARLAAARDLKDAEAQRKSNQSLLDKISNREAEINAREEKVTSTEKKQNERKDLLDHMQKALDEREAGLTSREAETKAKSATLDAKLKQLRDIAA